MTNEITRFWAKVDKNGPVSRIPLSNCWVWTAGTDGRNRNGQFRIGKVKVSAHRYSFKLHNGSISDGMSILHHCDNSKCVNPSHLYEGTQLDNMRDRTERNRHWKYSKPDSKAVGNMFKHAKLNPDKVRFIRNSVGRSQVDLGKQFGVAQTVIGRVINRSIWKHVE